MDQEFLWYCAFTACILHVASSSQTLLLRAQLYSFHHTSQEDMWLKKIRQHLNLPLTKCKLSFYLVLLSLLHIKQKMVKKNPGWLHEVYIFQLVIFNVMFCNCISVPDSIFLTYTELYCVTTFWVLFFRMLKSAHKKSVS